MAWGVAWDASAGLAARTECRVTWWVEGEEEEAGAAGLVRRV